MFELEIEKTLSALTPLTMTRDRVIIAIAGPPAVGKSTFSKKLLKKIRATLEPESVLVPMDGFHHENSVLEARGVLARKGAPFTFDAEGLVTLVKHIKTHECAITYPIFDRAADCSIAEAGLIEPQTKIILIEGNYLLLEEAPWSELAPLFDLTMMISATENILEQRLIQRWIDNHHTPEEARTRAQSNDIPNAHYVTQNSRPAMLNFLSQ